MTLLWWEKIKKFSKHEVCSLRTANAFPVVASLPPLFFGGREAMTGNAFAVRRLWSIPPSLLISSSKMPFNSKKSKKAVCGMVWISSGPGCVGHHMKSYMKYRLSKFTFIMCCNAEIIFFSHEIRAKMLQKLVKQNHRYTYTLLITHA